MPEHLTDIRDRILAALLPDIVFDGWTWQAAQAATVRAGYDRSMALAAFPGRLADVMAHFSDRADRQMLNRLAETDIAALKIRQRIRLAVETRLRVLEPWKEPVKLAAQYWGAPYRMAAAGRVTWRSAEVI